MRLATALVLLLAFGSAPASAQIDPDDAFPLEVGNVWEFWDFDYSYSLSAHTIRWEVVGEQTVGGETVPLLETFGTEYAAGDTCAVRTTAQADGSVVFTLQDRDDLSVPCQNGGVFPVYLDPATSRPIGMRLGADREGISVDINGTTVSGNAWVGVSDDFGVSSFSRTSYSYRVLPGIGPVSFSAYYQSSASHSEYAPYVYTLQYARIGGVEYGGSPIPTEPTELQAYLPHAVGDEWQYETFDFTVPSGYVVMKVTATTDPSARPAVYTLDVLRRPTTGTARRLTCTVTETAYTQHVEVRASGGDYGDCDGLFPTGYGRPVTFRVEQGPGPVTVGGQTYTFERVNGYGSYRPPGSGSVRSDWSAVAARGLGIYTWERSPSGVRARLVYANLGGAEYGVRAVAGEGTPEAAGALAVTVGPNPASERATVRYTLAEAGAVRVEVVDALGRTVRVAEAQAGAGAASSVLDVRGLATGVYTVRVVAGAQAASARLAVVR